MFLKVKSQSDIPEINEYQCGPYEMQLPREAQAIAKNDSMTGCKSKSNESCTWRRILKRTQLRNFCSVQTLKR